MNRIVELDASSYDRVRPLFAPEPAYVFCAAVLAGRASGRVWVDDAANPTSAFVITRGVWAYLAGRADNEAFNAGLNRALFAGEIAGADAFGLLLTCQSRDWFRHIPAITAPREPGVFRRSRYEARPDFAFDWRPLAPAGYDIRPVHHDLHNLEGDLPHDVAHLLARMEPDSPPLDHGFGYVAVRDGRVAAHAVVDAIAGKRGDIGLVTQEGHRRQGLATVTAAATLEDAFRHGLAVVHWDCNADNAGSVRTAEKLGLKQLGEDVMFVLAFDEEQHERMLTAPPQ